MLIFIAYLLMGKSDVALERSRQEILQHPWHWRSQRDSNPCFSLERANRRELASAWKYPIFPCKSSLSPPFPLPYVIIYLCIFRYILICLFHVFFTVIMASIETMQDWILGWIRLIKFHPWILFKTLVLIFYINFEYIEDKTIFWLTNNCLFCNLMTVIRPHSTVVEKLYFHVEIEWWNSCQ